MNDTMHKLFITCLAIMFALYVICAVLYVSNGTTRDTVTSPPASYYALSTLVVGVDCDADLVTCEDCNGNLWEFYGAEDWEVGDNANLLMNSKGTPKIQDDEICGATYANWDLSH